MEKSFGDKVKNHLNNANSVGRELAGIMGDGLRNVYKQVKAQVEDWRNPSVETTSPQPAPVTTEVADTPAPEVSEPEGIGNPDIAVQIFGRVSCPWTGRAITILDRYKLDYEFEDFDGEFFTPGIEERLVAETKQNTVPYIYLRGYFIGGYNALHEVERLGQLKALTDEDAAEFRKHNNVEIAQRTNSDETAPGEN